MKTGQQDMACVMPLQNWLNHKQAVVVSSLNNFLFFGKSLKITLQQKNLN